MGRERNWTKEEIEFLQDKWGVISISNMTKHLNRSVIGIKLKAQRLELGGYIQSGELITLCQLIKALGLFNSYSWIKKKFIDNGLPIVKKKADVKSKKGTLMVNIDKFWKWAEKNKQILNFSRFEKGNLGKEPLWINEKRKADKLNPSKLSHNRVWSRYDDNLLIELTKSCKYNYKDLANRFNRTEAAIKRRLKDLDVPYRPVPLDNHIKWTKEENHKMIELWNKGYDAYAIAKALNKTQLSITDRLEMFRG